MLTFVKEQCAHNGLVPGSSPGGPTGFSSFSKSSGHRFGHKNSPDIQDTIDDLATWLTRQTDQAIISHTLILLNSINRNASLAQIAENTARWEAAVRAAGR